MFRRSEEHLIDLLYKEMLGVLTKEELKFIIEEEKRLGVFNLDKAYELIWGWIDPN